MSKQNKIQQSQNNSNLPVFDNIRQWAEQKGLYKNGDLKTQALKLFEEAGELAKAILNDDECEIIDAIGDCTVVLTNVAKLASIKYQLKNCSDCNCESRQDCSIKNDMEITIENCIGAAYNTIVDRKGKMINGTFVKNS
jgi:NTP pyrophosphatase (non-canonical NTP hydrolase)